MIDHISLRVSDFQKSLSFYKAALEPQREGASHGYAHLAGKENCTICCGFGTANH